MGTQDQRIEERILIAPDAAALAHSIEEAGQFLLEARRIFPWSELVTAAPPADEIALALRQIALLSRSGASWVEAFRAVADSSASPRLTAALADVSARLSAGSSLPAALEMHADVFDALLVAATRAAADPVRVQLAFQRRAEGMLEREELVRKLRNALSYPVLLLGMSGNRSVVPHRIRRAEHRKAVRGVRYRAPAPHARDADTFTESDRAALGELAENEAPSLKKHGVSSKFRDLFRKEAPKFDKTGKLLAPEKMYPSGKGLKNFLRKANIKTVPRVLGPLMLIPGLLDDRDVMRRGKDAGRSFHEELEIELREGPRNLITPAGVLPNPHYDPARSGEQAVFEHEDKKADCRVAAYIDPSCRGPNDVEQ